MNDDKSIEHAVLTLRKMTQERRGRGIGAVMLLEEQIIALRAELAATVADSQDAVRYHYIRDYCLVTLPNGVEVETQEQLDAAMKGEK